ncbi:hypothetical protein [Bradyrhizobium sp. CCBAU 51627]|uniref:hypothetical protein n=1 Tax=Bradyrhizobium sp. CCBAU 51627 TaxID=1325088 RepID=UPI002305BAF1|nr:hypothetical protein [Bradyrhizobium sp. CCBAU 51627]MDA9430493.1 hypothetical protein [Bradyrhizobium sp. CCBAU 51627]
MRPDWVEIASGIRIFIELVNAQFLKMGGSGERAGIALARERGWIELHESGTFQRAERGRSAGGIAFGRLMPS